MVHNRCMISEILKQSNGDKETMNEAVKPSIEDSMHCHYDGQYASHGSSTLHGQIES